MGPIEVPSRTSLWGAQTQRSLGNFKIGGHRFTRPMIRALGVVKKCAAQANIELGELDTLERGAAGGPAASAADEVVRGEHDDMFPLVVWQTGSGTQSNMNANEVISNRAIQILGGELGSKTPIHPNDHVNRAQSSNDTFPTAMHVAAAEQTRPDACSRRSRRSRRALLAQGRRRGRTSSRSAARTCRTRHAADRGAGVLRLGPAAGRRAPPIEARPCRRCTSWPWAAPRWARAQHAPALRRSCPPPKIADGDRACPSSARPNKFSALAGHDAWCCCTGPLKTPPPALMKIANDVRWLGSARAAARRAQAARERAGQLDHARQGQPDPVRGHDHGLRAGHGQRRRGRLRGLSQGNFELNVFKPVMIHNVLESMPLLADACDSFREKCIDGLELDAERVDDPDAPVAHARDRAQPPHRLRQRRRCARPCSPWNS